MWVPSHVGIFVNDFADLAATEAKRRSLLTAHSPINIYWKNQQLPILCSTCNLELNMAHILEESSNYNTSRAKIFGTNYASVS